MENDHASIQDLAVFAGAFSTVTTTVAQAASTNENAVRYQQRPDFPSTDR